jgi:hypothetical protein
MMEPPALVNLGKINNDDPSVGSEKIMDERTSSNREITSEDPWQILIRSLMMILW